MRRCGLILFLRSYYWQTRTNPKETRRKPEGNPKETQTNFEQTSKKLRRNFDEKCDDIRRKWGEMVNGIFPFTPSEVLYAITGHDTLGEKNKWKFYPLTEIRKVY